jgi:hypothetical protein
MTWNATSSFGNAQGKTSLFLWKGTTAYIWLLPELSFTIRVAIGAVLHHFHERAEMPYWCGLSTTAVKQHDLPEFWHGQALASSQAVCSGCSTDALPLLP